jgi:hypothetical protein
MYINHTSHASYVLTTDKLLRRPEKNAYWQCLIFHTLSSKIRLQNGVELLKVVESPLSAQGFFVCREGYGEF